MTRFDSLSHKHTPSWQSSALRTLLFFIALAAFASRPQFCDAAEKPLKVFILVGQSNMQGHAHIRTFEHIGMDPETKPLLDKMQNADGTPSVCKDVWISYLSAGGVKTGRLTAGFGANEEKIGPEFTFGLRMEEKLSEPILIIKTAWGGKSLHTDFRPPSAGPYVFNESQLANFEKQKKDIKAIEAEKEKATGHYYRLMMDHVKSVLGNIKQVYPEYDSNRGYELAGLVWFQGWNDMVDGGVYPNRGEPGGYDDYSKLFAHFIRDVRKDLDSPELPVVIGVLGVNGPVSEYGQSQQRYKRVHQNFRDAMAAPANKPEFQGNVKAVLTEKYWDLELSQLQEREGKIRNELRKQQKEQNLSRKEMQEREKQLLAKEFTERERETLEKGISNGGYHYLGSAKIMAGIGIGFADAMIELIEE